VAAQRLRHAGRLHTTLHAPRWFRHLEDARGGRSQPTLPGGPLELRFRDNAIAWVSELIEAAGGTDIFTDRAPLCRHDNPALAEAVGRHRPACRNRACLR
jgi:hypothetical protein